jgi:excisionase family DNA binding protein
MKSELPERTTRLLAQSPTRLLHPVSEAAQILGVGRTTLYGLFKAGEIKSVRIGTRTVVPHSELEAYVERLTAEAS